MRKGLQNVARILKQNRWLTILVGVLVLGVVLSFFRYSYALFVIKSEQPNSFSLIAGELTYTLSGDKLNHDQVSVGANQAVFLTLTLTSQNEVDSKYQIYYMGKLPSGAKVVYQEKNTTLGTIGKTGEVMIVKLVIENPTSSTFTLRVGVKGGFLGNSLSFDSEQQLITENYLTKIPTVTVNPTSVTINAGTSYNLKTGVSARDAYGKDLTARITMTQGNGTATVTWDNHTIGSTKIYYHVTDDYGKSNGSTSALRTINVNRVYVYNSDPNNQITAGWTNYITTCDYPTFYGAGYQKMPLVYDYAGTSNHLVINGVLSSSTDNLKRSILSLATNYTVDLSYYKYLVFRHDVKTTDGSVVGAVAVIGCFKNFTNANHLDPVIAIELTGSGTTPGNYYFNVSNITSKCYPGVYIMSTDKDSTIPWYVTVPQVWLE